MPLLLNNNMLSFPQKHHPFLLEVLRHIDSLGWADWVDTGPLAFARVYRRLVALVADPASPYHVEIGHPFTHNPIKTYYDWAASSSAGPLFDDLLSNPLVKALHTFNSVSPFRLGIPRGSLVDIAFPSGPNLGLPDDEAVRGSVISPHIPQSPSRCHRTPAPIGHFNNIWQNFHLNTF